MDDDESLRKWTEAIELLSVTMGLTAEEVKKAIESFSKFDVQLIKMFDLDDDKARDFENEMLEVYEDLPGGNIENLECPNAESSECYNRDLLHMIIHLNDHHLWSREKIADWVEYFEDTEGVSLAFEEKKDE